MTTKEAERLHKKYMDTNFIKQKENCWNLNLDQTKVQK